MGSFTIQGGHRLEGEIRVSGAKNSILPIMAATLLTRQECVIQEIPDLQDVRTMMRILEALGARTAFGTERATGRHYLRVSAESLTSCEVSSELMGEMRSSIVVMGPLLGRLGKARVSQPGGCSIGSRPINFHLRGLESLGARFDRQYGYIDGETTGLVGREVHLDFPSVTTTENLMMAAVLADGVTVLHNAAREPEVIDLQNFLVAMGARITGAGMDAVRITGTKSLRGVEHAVIPDRIEAGTFMTAAAVTGSDLTITNAAPGHLDAVAAKYCEAGVPLLMGRDLIRVRGSQADLKAVDFRTMPYPGFPTDMQPLAMVLMCFTKGLSLITESIFEKRFAHAGELLKMGAAIDIVDRFAVVRGAGRLSGAGVKATDLRAGAALAVAGLAAAGTTVVSDTYHIERGYEDLAGKLASVGAVIEKDAG